MTIVPSALPTAKAELPGPLRFDRATEACQIGTRMARAAIGIQSFLGVLLALGCRAHSEAPPVAPRPWSSSSPVSTDPPVPAEQVELGGHGQCKVEVVVSENLLPDDPKAAQSKDPLIRDRGRLHDSVVDLVRVLNRMTGGRCTLSSAAAARGPGLVALYVGDAAEKRFGPLTQHPVAGQSLRVVAQRGQLGLYGDSDLASSYAVYTLLDQLGCRWFMPGPLGEVVPEGGTVVLPPSDRWLAPSTWSRNLWYADADYKRRNRLGGDPVPAAHVLETYVSAVQRAEHPEWRATIGGKPSPTRLEWHLPEVADAISQAILQNLEKASANGASLSPGDGMDFSESPADRALDAGDMTESSGTVSLTDRYLVLANRVAERVSARHPEVVLGMLAYARIFRPPVREPVHPSLVPTLAPIAQCRVHAITDTTCESQSEFRNAIDGWGKRSHQLAFRGYLYNLSEPSAPNPMMRKLAADVPYLISHGVKFWQPETLPNFDTSLPGIWLSNRLAWDVTQSPEAVLSELFVRFYGHAEQAMRAYWEYMDGLWVDTPEHSGSSLSYGRRFTPERMAQARLLMDQALRDCETVPEYQRVELANQSLALFERFMRLRNGLWTGQVQGLSGELEQWKSLAAGLGVLHGQDASFTPVGWARSALTATRAYSERFVEPTLNGAVRISGYAILTRPPITRFRYRFEVPATEPCEAPSVPDQAWPETDVAKETWATLGRMQYFGTACYRAGVPVVPERPGEKSYLWVGSYDGSLRAFADGVELVAVDKEFKPTVAADSFAQPQSFALPPISARGVMKIAFRGTRTALRELGGGGLTGPVVMYRVPAPKPAPAPPHGR